MTPIRFLSRNEHKTAEAARILAGADVKVVPIHFPLTELQTDDVAALVRDKTLKAFYKVGRPLFVEQTGLFLDRLEGLPGGLTQVFWDALGPDRVSSLFGQGEGTGVIARTRIGFCDGRTIHQFEGEIRGRIAAEPRGDRAFQWDCVFIPDGFEQTFSEMGENKDEISMRRRALDAFVQFLKGGTRA
ncbi:non-canonical purine NTP pyrophosphatase [Sphingomonas lenta]|uniref:Non-canonical purine NTP pyrophosphatase n=1 Tax=Sphingomonas lenta TaxID=1141887 RepID=A0A2A2SIA8_9SPHN|nr:non-canonical purine NTP pyrophosphatase [Sphingomonas lenta]PAX09014.1 non-canonical purine NTP pyrophosphatase [Sphingomonas lenta]